MAPSYLFFIAIIVCITSIFILSQMNRVEFTALEVDSIDISEGNKEIIRNANLGIFKDKIYPSAKGTYTFNVKNSSKYKQIYNIRFMENMKSNINIKYRLKKGNDYIRGNETTYVELCNLDLESIIILPNTENKYILEWKWEESPNDTEIASLEETQDYTLKMQIISNIYDK